MKTYVLYKWLPNKEFCLLILLPSRLYCRLQLLTESTVCQRQPGRGLTFIRTNHRRLGISPDPEGFLYEIGFIIAQSIDRMNNHAHTGFFQSLPGIYRSSRSRMIYRSLSEIYRPLLSPQFSSKRQHAVCCIAFPGINERQERIWEHIWPYMPPDCQNVLQSLSYLRSR